MQNTGIAQLWAAGPAGLAALAALCWGATAALAETGVMPHPQDLAGLEVGMQMPPLPAPLNWMGGGCFNAEDEPLCAKGYSLLTGTDGAYAALTTGASAGHDDKGQALWMLIDLVALRFPTKDSTYFMTDECSGGPEDSMPVLFFEQWPAEGAAMPQPIWGAEIHKTTAMIRLIDDLSTYRCAFEEP